MSFDRNTASLAEYSSKGHIFQVLYHLGSSERNEHWRSKHYEHCYYLCASIRARTKLFRHFYFWGVPKEMNIRSKHYGKHCYNLCAGIRARAKLFKYFNFTFGEFRKKWTFDLNTTSTTIICARVFEQGSDFPSTSKTLGTICSP